MTTTTSGVQKLDSSDMVSVVNNNADILDEHIEKSATADTLGHIKIGTGLQVTDDGVANVKIENSLKSDATDKVLSAASGKELSDKIDFLSEQLTWQDCVIELTDNTSGTVDAVNNGIELKINGAVKINTTGWVTIGKIPSNINISRENSFGKWVFVTAKDDVSANGYGYVGFDNTICMFSKEVGIYYFTVDVPLTN